MKNFSKALALSLGLSACGQASDAEKKPEIVDSTPIVVTSTPDKSPASGNKELEALKLRVAELETLASTFNEAAESPEFTDCEVETNSLKKTICRIAQAANQEQLGRLQVMFGEFAKQYQNAIFGSDCAPTGDAQCPKAGSLAARLKDIETLASYAQTLIPTILQDISDLKNRSISIENELADGVARIEDLEAADLVIENLISSLDSRLDALETRVQSIESRLDSLEGAADLDSVLRPIELCGSNQSAGPVYETVQVSGTFSKLYAMIRQGSSVQLGLIVDALSLGRAQSAASLPYNDSYVVELQTSIASKTCRAIVVRRPNGQGGLQVCWDKTTPGKSHSSLVAAYKTANRPNLICKGDTAGSW